MKPCVLNQWDGETDDEFRQRKAKTDAWNNRTDAQVKTDAFFESVKLWAIVIAVVLAVTFIMKLVMDESASRPSRADFDDRHIDRPTGRTVRPY